jgi:hypothetical protein
MHPCFSHVDLDGLGYGLPVSRMYAEYLGGSLRGMTHRAFVTSIVPYPNVVMFILLTYYFFESILSVAAHDVCYLLHSAVSMYGFGTDVYLRLLSVDKCDESIKI